LVETSPAFLVALRQKALLEPLVEILFIVAHPSQMESFRQVCQLFLCQLFLLMYVVTY
jgi:hypothetical protein